jgi:hypothetical protein
VQFDPSLSGELETAAAGPAVLAAAWRKTTQSKTTRRVTVTSPASLPRPPGAPLQRRTNSSSDIPLSST